jgi:hypothetical protein
MGIFDYVKNRGEIKKAKAEIDKAKDNICSSKLIHHCAYFADDFINIINKLNLLEDKDKYDELYNRLEIFFFATSIVIIAYHGDNSSINIIYNHMLHNNLNKHDKRINLFLNNVYRFIDNCAIKVWGPEKGRDNKGFYSDVVQRFGEYSKTIQHDEFTSDLKYYNTLNKLIDNYICHGISSKNDKSFNFGGLTICNYDEKLSKENRDKLIEALYDLFMHFYQSCAEIFYPSDAMLKLFYPPRNF